MTTAGRATYQQPPYPADVPTGTPTGTAAGHRPRKAYRDTDNPVIGGVAGGLARHLAVPVVYVRAALVITAVLSGLGIALYAVWWVVLPGQDRFEQGTPGADSAIRGGRRPGRVRRITDAGPAIALAVLGVGLVLLAQSATGLGAVFWPVVIGVVGIALLWRQADEAQRERWFDTSGRLDPVRLVLGRGGWAAYLRLGAGVVLVAAALTIAGLAGGSLSQARGSLVAGGLGMLGILLVAGPWIARLVSDLGAERTERIRTQERADVAAHLHDSVLQTLALIQKNAADSATVTRLARAQERDLRSWLYVGEAIDDTTVAGALRSIAAQVEDAHSVSVDVVTVGDAPYDESLRAVVAASGEAMTNAARHSGTSHIDVFAEVTDAVEVFVRDRGSGFDPDQLPEDRHGVRHSIRDRMARHGGTAEIRSTPGEGTEVRLRLPRVTRTATEESR